TLPSPPSGGEGRVRGAGWTSMKPPPPRLPASGQTTARANAVATAASTALPPFFNTSRPIADASGATETTMPRRPREVAVVESSPRAGTATTERHVRVNTPARLAHSFDDIRSP